MAARRSVRRWIVTRRSAVVHLPPGALDDLRCSGVSAACGCIFSRPSTAALRRGSPSRERPARIPAGNRTARVIQGVDADEDVGRAHLRREARAKARKMVLRRHVRHGMPWLITSRAGPWGRACARQGRAAEDAQIDGDDDVLDDVHGAGDASPRRSRRHGAAIGEGEGVDIGLRAAMAGVVVESSRRSAGQSPYLAWHGRR